ncbi:restriction endonuclease [Candidatus Spongiihabitans sp.]|uniref:restriction endonuclease n=1 Tax=Candidatus Spongiihabitans sp. TaxID=3101308 RepID=UPI003C79E53E
MDWKEYEKEIYDHFKFQYPDAEITLNAKKLGIHSKIHRQIDVLIEQYVAGNRITIVVEGKYRNKKIDVEIVEGFIKKVEDIGAHKGLLISKNGFSKAAFDLAHNGSSNIELDILNFKDIKQFQAHCALPYAGENCVLIPAPFGWIIDGTRRDGLGVATMYQQGLSLNQAMVNMEFMYVHFWDRKKDDHDLDDLLKIQEENLKKIDTKVKIEYRPTIRRDKEKTALRIAKLKNYPTNEYTGFIEFPDFIFFCVMFSPDNKSNTNIRKLENILKMALPIKIANPEDM